MYFGVAGLLYLTELYLSTGLSFEQLVLYPFMLIVNEKHELCNLLCIREITVISHMFYSGLKFGLDHSRTGVQ